MIDRKAAQKLTKDIDEIFSLINLAQPSEEEMLLLGRLIYLKSKLRILSGYIFDAEQKWEIETGLKFKEDVAF